MGQFGELWYLSSGILRILLQFLVEFVTTHQKQLKITDLMNETLLSDIIKKKVQKVERNIDITVGSGGTGTERFTLTAHLTDGSALHLFIKVPTESLFEKVFLTLFRVYDNELNFYANIRPHLPDLHNTTVAQSNSEENSLWCPDVYCAKSYGAGKFLLILEDVRFRQQKCDFQGNMDCFSQDKARAVLKLMSKMHAHFWNAPPVGVWAYSAQTGLSLGTTPPMLRLIATHAMQTVTKRYGSLLIFHRDVMDAFILLIDNYEAVRRFWSTGPLTLCHGDAHMANTFIHHSSGVAGFVDMQCVAAEHCMRDVSYHLINSCPAEDLGGLEEGLITYYLSQLNAHHTEQCKQSGKVTRDGESILSYGNAHFLYRTHAMWTLTAWVISCGASDLVQEVTAVSSLNRVAAAVHRLDSLGAMRQVLTVKI